MSTTYQAASGRFFYAPRKPRMPLEIDREDQKRIIKEAIREWLDEKYAAFGRWSFDGILAAALGALGYYLATHGGFK